EATNRAGGKRDRPELTAQIAVLAIPSDHEQFPAAGKPCEATDAAGGLEQRPHPSRRDVDDDGARVDGMAEQAAMDRAVAPRDRPAVGRPGRRRRAPFEPDDDPVGTGGREYLLVPATGIRRDEERVAAAALPDEGDAPAVRRECRAADDVGHDLLHRPAER